METEVKAFLGFKSRAGAEAAGCGCSVGSVGERPWGSSWSTMVLAGLGSFRASVSPPDISITGGMCWARGKEELASGARAPSEALCEGGVHLAGRKSWPCGRKAV